MHPTLLSSFNKPFLTRQSFFFQDQTPSPSSSFVVNDPAAETGDGGTQNQSLPEEIQDRLKEIFAWLQKDARDQIRDVDHFEEILEPISQKLPEDIKVSLEPSLDWTFIMWQ
jgi:hypothetical protein